ncbi:hypothetical protein BDV95DRAFT_380397 [Massariosphaeria phaeospora]|uniref:Uncharacterized protein n=1 Tax=Massariosphaeria phaeospora TaxID=100035 RepID=A0A7C8IAI0_9PLEO|nr:hypothetical protein BDV95DRAFT_380397 [Massariosphaeria phaeospora]
MPNRRNTMSFNQVLEYPFGLEAAVAEASAGEVESLDEEMLDNDVFSDFSADSDEEEDRNEAATQEEAEAEDENEDEHRPDLEMREVELVSQENELPQEGCVVCETLVNSLTSHLPPKVEGRGYHITDRRGFIPLGQQLVDHLKWWHHDNNPRELMREHELPFIPLWEVPYYMVELPYEVEFPPLQPVENEHLPSEIPLGFLTTNLGVASMVEFPALEPGGNELFLCDDSSLEFPEADLASIERPAVDFATTESVPNCLGGSWSEADEAELMRELFGGLDHGDNEASARSTPAP